MKYWKRFVGWVIDLRRDPFVQARLKLTLLYTVIITLAIILYLLILNREFKREAYNFARQNVPPRRQSLFMRRAEIVASITLFTVQPEDVGMFFLTILLSYLLADFALKPIKRILVSYKQFLAIASHELRTPISIMKIEFETFLREKKSIRRKGTVVSNLEEIEKMQQIIDNLLFLSRSDSYIEEFRLVKVNLSFLLEQVKERLREAAKVKHIRLSLFASEGIVIFSAPVRLEQAIMNVVQNAIKYTKNGGKVEIVAKEKETSVTITIKDTGIGIAEKDLPYIFNRFYRAQSLTTQKIEGIGLGLYIANTIIKAHKGKIIAKSEVGKGTTVEISLPRAFIL